MFNGFTEETVRYFMDIRFHNNATYYEENKDRYRQHVQAPFYAFIEALAPTMQQIDPRMEVRPYKCLARMRRDTRFSKDKSPYRDHLWLLFRKAGEPREGSVVYWFEFGPDTFGWGLGLWSENRPAMDMLRRKIAAQPQQIQQLIAGCNLSGHSLVMGGSTFKRMAVPESVPDALRPLYLTKELFIHRAAPVFRWAYQPDLVTRVREDFITLAPIYRLLRGIVDDAQLQSDD